jgi:hypothetical protein
MGVDIADDAALDRALDQREVAPWRRAVAAVTVVRAARLGEGVRINLGEASTRRALSWRIVQEDGDYREERFDPVTLEVLEEFQRGALNVRAYRLRLPGDLPEGYHRLAVVENGALLAEGVLVVAPERCYLPPQIADGARVWGPALQLYGVRSGKNAGIGDFGDLREAIETWGKAGAALVGTNPLHALSPREPAKASPYSPSSRLFLNALYLDIEAIEDFRELAAKDGAFGERWREACAALREAELVDYTRVAAEKRAMLEALYANFQVKHLSAATRRSRDFARYREVQGQALRRHAIHEALAEFHAMSWRQWPEEHRDPASAQVADFAKEHAERVAFHEYLQWQADLQLSQAQARARELGMAIGLYADLAISIDGGGSESWANQGLYAIGAAVGAPPDEFNTKGQDWGLAPLHPLRPRAGRIRRFRGDAPRQHGARRRAAHRPRDGAHAALVGARRARRPRRARTCATRWTTSSRSSRSRSHRNRCMVIGEDLGTVPGISAAAWMAPTCSRTGSSSSSATAWASSRRPPSRARRWWRGPPTTCRRSPDGGAARTWRRARAWTSPPPKSSRPQREERGRQGPLSSKCCSAKVRPPWGARRPTTTSPSRRWCSRSTLPRAHHGDGAGGADGRRARHGPAGERPGHHRRASQLAAQASPPAGAVANDARVKRLARSLSAMRGSPRSRATRPRASDQARIPRATYRVQLHADFNFAKVTRSCPTSRAWA